MSLMKVKPYAAYLEDCQNGKLGEEYTMKTLEFLKKSMKETDSLSASVKGT